MIEVETLAVLWRAINGALAIGGLVLLYLDVRRRRKTSVSVRFYWEAMGLLLLSAAYGSIEAIWHPETFTPVRSAITTVAVSYFVLSLYLARRARRVNTRNEGTNEYVDGL